MYYKLGINDLVLYLLRSICFPVAHREVQTPSAWHSRPLTVGWPIFPGLPGISLVWAVKVLYPRNHLTSVHSGMVSHSTFGILPLTELPSSSTSIFFCTPHFIYSKWLVPQTGHSLFYLPTSAHASLCLGSTPYLLLPAGLVFLWDGLGLLTALGAQITLIYGIVSSSVSFCLILYYLLNKHEKKDCWA